MPSPYRFSTQRERDIYRLLLLIGEGPAAHFSDACRIMSEEDTFPFRSSTHLVGHLLREIESAIRAVLLTFANREEKGETKAGTFQSDEGKTKKAKKASGSDDQKREITLILSYCGLEEDGRAGQVWLSLAGKDNPTALHSLAHRSALGRPRPLDNAFRLHWDGILDLLQVVLSRFELSYVTAIDVVDELLAIENPTQEDASRLRQKVPNSRSVLEYFFTRCQNLAWVELLTSEGYFAQPPGLEVDEATGETLGYPIWSASRYLVRMACKPEAQPTIEQVVRRLMETDNPRVRQDILEILTDLPADRIADLATQVAEWLG